MTPPLNTCSIIPRILKFFHLSIGCTLPACFYPHVWKFGNGGCAYPLPFLLNLILILDGNSCLLLKYLGGITDNCTSLNSRTVLFCVGSLLASIIDTFSNQHRLINYFQYRHFVLNPGFPPMLIPPCSIIYRIHEIQNEF